MNFNSIIKITDITDESGATAEPVTIQEFKNYMRLEGFVDDDASTTEALSDFDFDDGLIAEMLVQSRRIIESNTDDNLIVKTLSVIATNLCGMLKLPGPVNTKPTIIDENGFTVDPTSVTMVGDYLKCPMFRNMTLTYTAGHVHCPKKQKNEVMRIAAFFYLNRTADAREKFVAQLPAKILA